MSNKSKVYVVKNNDTLDIIIDKLKVSLDELIKYNNNLDIDNIKVGHLVIIPESSPIYK